MTSPDALRDRFKHPCFCTLEYRPTTANLVEPATGPVILLVHSTADGGLSLLVDPNWRAFVLDEDAWMLEELLRDFVQRARLDPCSLFKHLCGVNFGCLVTAATGEKIAEAPAVVGLVSRFERL